MVKPAHRGNKGRSEKERLKLLKMVDPGFCKAILIQLTGQDSRPISVQTLLKGTETTD